MSSFQKAEKIVKEKLNINRVMVEAKPSKPAYERSIRNALLGVFGQENQQVVQSLMAQRPHQYEKFRQMVVDAKARLMKGENSILQKVRNQLQKGKGQKIASGSIGAVQKIVLPDGREFVVKKRHKTQSIKQIQQFNHQAQVNQSLQRKIGDKHIMPRYYGKTTINGVPHMVFEKMDGDLVALFSNDLFLLEDVKEKDDLIKQLWDIYHTLQKAGICHGDLHEGNIYYKNENGRIRLLIGDFGTASDLDGVCGDRRDVETLVDKIEKKHVQDTKKQQLSKTRQLQKQQFTKTMKQFQQKRCVPVIKPDATEEPGDWGECRCDRNQSAPSRCSQEFANICAMPNMYSKYDVETELESCS